MATKTANAKTAALEALIEAHAGELKLPTVKARFRAMAAEATRDQQTPIAYLAALLEAEQQERSERRERRRLVEARFPVMKSLEEFRFADNPKVPQATIAALAEGSWIDDRESVIFVGESDAGATASGDTHFAARTSTWGVFFAVSVAIQPRLESSPATRNSPAMPVRIRSPLSRAEPVTEPPSRPKASQARA